MVENVFAQNPVSRALNEQDATLRATEPTYGGGQPAQPEPTSLEELSRSSRVPLGILQALGEASGADESQRLSVAQRAAQKLAPLIAAGKKPSDALAEALGGPQGLAATKQIMARARELAGKTAAPQAEAPKGPATDGGMGIADTAISLGQGAAQGVGIGVQGLGEGLAMMENKFVRNPVNAVAELATGKPALGPAPNRLDTAAKGWNNIAEMIGAHISDQSKQSIKGSMPSGKWNDPSTWSLGSDPSLRGYVMQGANVFGSMLPIVISAVATDGASVPAMMGAAQSAGDQAQTSDQLIEQMANTKVGGFDGPSQLETESKTYQGYIAQGMSPADAKEATKRDAAQFAAMIGAPIGALGEGVLSKIINPAEKLVAGGNRIVQAGGRAALGAGVEGTQEAAEGIGGAVGSNIGAGTNNDVMKDAVPNFVLGAIGGGVAGGAAGAAAMSHPEVQQDQPGPAPDPTPPGPTPGGPSNGLPGPDSPPPGAGPKGPFQEAAGAGAGPKGHWADWTPGERVHVGAPEGSFTAEFVRDTPFGPVIREDDGTETTIPREYLDDGRVIFMRMGGDDSTAYTAPEDQPSAGAAPKPDADTGVDPATDPADLTPFGRRDGSPFPTAKAAARGGMSRLGHNQFTIHAVEGGFMVAPLPPKAEPADAGAGDFDDEYMNMVNSLVGDGMVNGSEEEQPDQPGAEAPAVDPAPQPPEETHDSFDPEASPETVQARPQAETGPEVGNQGPAQVAQGEEPGAHVAGHPGELGVGQGNPAVLAKPEQPAALIGAPEPTVIAPPVNKPAALSPPAKPAEPVKEAEPEPKIAPALKARMDELDTVARNYAASGKDLINEGTRTAHYVEQHNEVTLGAGQYKDGKNQFSAWFRPGPDGKLSLFHTYIFGKRVTTPRDQRKVLDALHAAYPEFHGKADAETEKPKSPGEIWAAHPDRAREAHAKANLVVDRVLPGRQKEGVPLADIQVGQDQHGRFLVRHSIHTSDSGHANPMGGDYATAAEAEAAGAAEIRKHAKAIIDSPANGAYSATARADAQKVIEWLDSQASENPVQENPAVSAEAPTQETDNTQEKVPSAPQEEPAPQAPASEEPVKTPETPAPVAEPEADAEPDHAANVTAAVDQVNTEPTDGQKEAGNYAKGHLKWNGLDLTIENPKGSERSGFAGEMPPVPEGHIRLYRGEATPKELPEWLEQAMVDSGVKDVQGRWFTPSLVNAMWYVRDAGEGAKLRFVDVPRAVYDASRVQDNPEAKAFSRDPETENLIPREWADKAVETPATGWAVTLPAHYGYIKGTIGGDGEHVDFYMGDNPEAGRVLVIDQVNLPDKDFDEHKVMMGFKSLKAAREAYIAGFSDGKGADRLGGAKAMTVDEFKAWLGKGVLGEPVSDAMAGKGTKVAKIEDFGGQIGGMRKSAAKKYVVALGGKIDPSGMTLSEAFPVPDYAALVANGASMDVVAAIALIRGAIGRKPVKSWEVDTWVDRVQAARSYAAAMLDGSKSADDAMVEVKNLGNRRQTFAVLRTMKDEAQIVWAANNLSLADRTIRLKDDDKDYTKVYYITKPGAGYEYESTVRERKHWTELNADTIPEIADEISAKAAVALKLTEKTDGDGPAVTREAKIEFQTRGPSGGKEAAIYVTSPRLIRLTEHFPSHAAARKYMEEHREELEARVRALRNGPKERRDENRHREGPQWRKGDATPAMFEKDLGFRAVAFGESMTAKERQEGMNATYDAMMDLAGVIGVPTKALSLDGKLALGFGTHGTGGKGHWAAVYFQSSDPTQDQVIALTRKHGPGTLAHEWWHAVDNYLARKDAPGSNLSAATTAKGAEERTEFMSDRTRKRHSGALPMETVAAFRELKHTLTNSAWKGRMDRIDGFSAKPYYGTIIELAARGFERMIVDELTQRGMINDYLANIDDTSGAYLTPSEFRRSGIGAAFDGALEAIKAELGVAGQTGPKLPDVNPDLVDKGPSVGTQWEGPNGWREITGYAPDTKTFTVTDRATGQTSEVREGAMPQTMENDAAAITPEGRAKAATAAAIRAARDEAQAADDAKKEGKASQREQREAEREKVDSEIKAFVASLPKRSEQSLRNQLAKQYNWPDPDGVLTRAHFVVRLVDRGWKVGPFGKGTALTGKRPDGHTGIWDRSALTETGMEFAEFYQKRFEKAEARKAFEEAEAARDAEAQAAQPKPFTAEDFANLLAEDSQTPEEQAPELEDTPGAEPVSADPTPPAEPVPFTAEDFANLLNEEAQAPEVSAESTAITTAFVEAFRAGQGFRTIVNARTLAGEAINRKIETTDYLMLEEAIELAVVKRAREIATQHSADPHMAYAELIDLYNRQPILGERTPDKTIFQAYSTPAPLAYIASRLAGIGPDTRVVEPTAGNGMLVMQAKPSNVQANELQSTRFAQLADVLGQEANLSQMDAMDLKAAPFDVLITNPPFGKVTDQTDQSRKGWPLGVTTTKEIDHAISWHMLGQMPDDGRAVLILGGVKKQLTGDERTKGYNELAKKSFFKQLYDTYNVVDHFTVAGELYNRQGAAWPVDVIVIDGRIGSTLPYPFATAPKVLSTWVEIGRKLSDAPDVDTTGRGPDLGGGNPVESGAPDSERLPKPAGRPDLDNAGNGKPGGSGTAGSGGGRGNGPRGPRTGSGGGSPDAGQRGAGNGTEPVGSDVAGPTQTDQPGGSGADQGSGSGNVPDGAVRPGLNPSEPSWSDIGAMFTSGLAQFGKGGKLYSGAAFLEDLYNALKPAFTAAIRKAAAAAGQKITDIMDMMRAVIKSLRNEAGMSTEQIAEITPYAVQYAQDVQTGKIDPFAEQKPEPKPPSTERVNNEQAGEYQVQYTPKSKATFAVGTLVPKGMQSAMTAALEAIEAKHGDIDEYVARELGYSLQEAITGTPDSNGKDGTPAYFSAEQVDALAMAINNVSQGRGFIIGDQTGIGKGRFVAAMLRYGARQGKIPVFVTQKPGLYADMVRDLRDIGMSGAQAEIIATNAGLEAIPINSDEDKFTGASAKELTELFNALHTGKMPKGKKYLFTTYDQMTTTSGKWPTRALALMNAAPKVMLVLDESHTAGGTETKSMMEGPRQPGQAPRNRAEFFRDLVGACAGSVFSSATYAKNPTVMSLYASTNLSLAVDDIDKLGAAIERGGVPLQQIAANQLTADGQYVRREKSFAGIQFDPVEMSTNRTHAIEVSATISDMAAFDRDTMTAIRNTVRENLESAGFVGTVDGSVGISSTSGAEFTSTVHNLVNQFLLAVKLDDAVNLAIEAHRNGEKPVITLMNVNSSIIDEYVEDAGLKVGDRAKIPFSAIMERYLERLRHITVKTISGQTIRIRITDEQMGADALREMEDLKEKIENMPLDGLTGSPVDAILDRLRAAGLKMDEITGRGVSLTGGVITPRKNTPALNKGRMNDFNSGKLDGLILSASGSTGFSMHARPKGKTNDGKVRHMIVLQAHADINVFMQTLGRVNRTGQSVLPKYSLAFSDLAIEKRSAAVLMKKMASLNANTTAGKRSALTLDVTDFVNEVGDKVMLEYLQADSFLALRLGFTGLSSAKAEIPADLAKKATGRFIYLHPDETDQHYEAIEAAYNDKIRELDQAGMNPLEAKTLDLQARLINSTILREGTGSGSALDQDLTSDTVSVLVAGTPHTPDEIKALVKKGLGPHEWNTDWVKAQQKILSDLMPDHMKNLNAVKQDRLDKLDAARKAQEQAADNLKRDLHNFMVAQGDVSKKPEQVAALEKIATASRRHHDKTVNQTATAQEGLNSIESRIQNEYDAVRQVGYALESVTPGKGFTITTPDEELNAVVIAVDMSKLGSNPSSAGKIRVRFAVSDGSKEQQYPLSKIMNQTPSLSFTGDRRLTDAFLKPFADGQSNRREERNIINGNLIAGIVQFKSQGQVVFYTTEDGTVKPGILMPKSFDMAQELADQDVVFTSTEFAARFVIDTPGSLLKNSDKNVTLTEDGWKRFKLSVNVAKGKPYFQLQAVQHLVTGFRQNGKFFQGHVSEANVKTLLDLYSQNLGASWIAEAHKDQARAIMGIVLPTAKPAGPKAMKADLRNGTKPEQAPKDADLRKIEADLNAELQRTGLFGKINLRLSRRLTYDGQSLLGYFLGRTIAVSTGGSVAALGILRHEIIHALRSSELWGKEYGVFSQEQWRALVANARADRKLTQRISGQYADYGAAAQIEEVIAEQYRAWAAKQDTKTPAGRIFARLHAVLQALVNALRGNGFTSTAAVFESIRSGEIMGPQDPSPGGPAPRGTGPQSVPAQRAEPPMTRGQGPRAMRAPDPVSDTQAKGFIENALTQAMSGKLSLLGLVPGRPLFAELGRKILSAQTYLRAKGEMDALRDEWHSTTDTVAQKWRKLVARNGKANLKMMELMHEATLAGVDPTKPFHRRASRRDHDTVAKLRPNSPAYLDAQARIDLDRERYADYLDLQQKFRAMPADFQSMFVEVRNTYTRMADTFEQTILDNITKAMKINQRRAEREHADELRRIDDDGLVGGERRAAIDAADAKLNRTRRRLGWGSASRTASLRATFESNRIDGPYFPLTRFGDFFATVRDDTGKVVAFARFETVRARDQFARAEGRIAGQTVQTGVLSQTDMKTMVDPNFVADIEQMIGDAGVSQDVMDAIWQRWLQTLPEMSVRRNRIHRKGTRGFSTDAFRAFGRHMFHGAHQLARLTYSMEMADALTEAEREAQRGPNPTRDGLIVGEMQRRHDYTMNPQGSAWAQVLSSAAFVWYMAFSPASALANLAQTTTLGIPVLSTLNPGRGGYAQAAKQISQALLDFTRGKGHAAQSSRLTQDERAAMAEAYRRGTIDKSQAHDLAGIADAGVSYSPIRTRIMGVISLFFHHTERLNREVTFLAAYRMAKLNGADHAGAIEKAADLTWRTHFDYQNSSRPRAVQGDTARVLLSFKNYQINMIYRLFRDTYASVAAGTEAEKREARKQLFGITASMLLHAGIKGTWGFSMIMVIAALVCGKKRDDLEEEFKGAVLETFGTDLGGALWYGTLGKTLGVDLSARIGMGDLWFRSPDEPLEGKAEAEYWLEQLTGVQPQMWLFQPLDALQKASEGRYERALEAIMPKAMRDMMKAYRYASEGVQTKNGDTIVEEVSPYETLVQALGFTPARVAEQNDLNNRLYNLQTEIEDEKQRLVKQAAKQLLNGEPISAGNLAAIEAFNAKHPKFAVTFDGIHSSARSTQMMHNRNEGGIALNPRLDEELRSARPPAVFD